MRTLLRVFAILALFVTSTNAQTIFAAGSRSLSDCGYAVRPLLADLNAIRFPSDWTIVVACTPAVWNYLQIKADARRTRTAFTNLDSRITVVNGAIYLEQPPLHGTAHRTPRTVLQHERGHILCRCGDEGKADSFSGLD